MNKPVSKINLPQIETYPRSENRERLIRRLDNYARLLDSRFKIPGTSITYGWDAIIGLLPVVGDVITFIFSATIIMEARRAGAPVKILGRMLTNCFIEFFIGMVPLLGDGFDLLWKANLKNVELLKGHLEKTTRANKPANPDSNKTFLYSVLLLIPVVVLLFYWMGSIGSEANNRSPQPIPAPAPPVEQQKLDHSPYDRSATYLEVAAVTTKHSRTVIVEER